MLILFYNVIIELVGHRLKKQDTAMRKSISPEERLIATLRFLSTGNSYEDLKFSTKIAAQTLGHIIPETCLALYDVLKDKYMKVKYLIFIILVTYLDNISKNQHIKIHKIIYLVHSKKNILLNHVTN